MKTSAYPRFFPEIEMMSQYGQVEVDDTLTVVLSILAGIAGPSAGLRTTEGKLLPIGFHTLVESSLSEAGSHNFFDLCLGPVISAQADILTDWRDIQVGPKDTPIAYPSSYFGGLPCRVESVKEIPEELWPLGSYLSRIGDQLDPIFTRLDWTPSQLYQKSHPRWTDQHSVFYIDYLGKFLQAAVGKRNSTGLKAIRTLMANFDRSEPEPKELPRSGFDPPYYIPKPIIHTIVQSKALRKLERSVNAHEVFPHFLQMEARSRAEPCPDRITTEAKLSYLHYRDAVNRIVESRFFRLPEEVIVLSTPDEEHLKGIDKQLGALRDSATTPHAPSTTVVKRIAPSLLWALCQLKEKKECEDFLPLVERLSIRVLQNYQRGAPKASRPQSRQLQPEGVIA